MPSAAPVPSGDPVSRVPVETVHLGALLLARRFIRQDQLDRAIVMQAEHPYLRIGEILLGLEFITFHQLRTTLEDQYRDVRLGKALLRMNVVNIPQIEAALQAQEMTGERLGPMLIQLGACSEAELYRALAAQELS
jgi:adenylate cyclase